MKQETIQKLYMYGWCISAVIIMAIAVLLFAKEEPIEKPVGADLVKCEVCEKCQVCGKITVQRIIDDNPAIELPDELVKFKYKGQEYSKKILDEAKIIIEAK